MTQFTRKRYSVGLQTFSECFAFSVLPKLRALSASTPNDVR